MQNKFNQLQFLCKNTSFSVKRKSEMLENYRDTARRVQYYPHSSFYAK